MKVKIGLEVHASLATQSKLFCSCAVRVDAPPNSLTCPVCLGHPGARIAVNKEAVIQVIALAQALSCTISDTLEFSRKTYFYPDSPRNYQITQHEKPIGFAGALLVDDVRVRIRRVHLEEDPGALSYPSALSDSEYSLIDYNRAGSPLVEIVTEPDFSHPSQVRVFMRKLASVLSYLGIRELDSSVKADANVSIEESGFTRVELKNITGFKSIEQALRQEIVRQKLCVRKGVTITSQTRGWDGEKTYVLRTKEEVQEYGYIREPNIPVSVIDDSLARLARERIPELADAKVVRYVSELGVEASDAQVLVQDRELAELFEFLAESVSAPLAARWVRREVLRVLNYTKKSFSDSPLTQQAVLDVLLLLVEKKITEQTGQQLMELLSEKRVDVRSYVEQEGLLVLSAKEDLAAVCETVIQSHEGAVNDYLAGEEKSLHYLIGQVMRHTRGRADPDVVRSVLLEQLSS